MIKKLLIFGLVGIFLLSGCKELKELYGVQPSTGEEYVPIEEVMVEEGGLGNMTENITEIPLGNITEIPPELPKEEVVEEKEPQEVVEEKPKGEAKVIIVTEKDLVSLKPQATDPDADKLAFSYTTPFNREGKWQTNYGDAGEYTITVTVSDGQLSTTKDVLVIVNKKEETPTIDEAIPKEATLEAKENSKLAFGVKASDLNEDSLKYSWKLDDAEVSTDINYTYNLGYDAAGQHTIKVAVSDGVNEASNTWALKIENVNRKPVLEEIDPIKIKETETAVLEPKATDPDNDKLTFSVDTDKFKKVDGRFEWETTYDDAGVYTITLAVSDGEDEVSQDIEVTIENVDRPPVIEDIILG